MRPTFFTVLLTGFLIGGQASAQTADDYVTRRINTVLSRHYEYKMISSGRNFPAVNVRRENRSDIILLLHEGVTVASIRDHFGWSEASMETRLTELVDAELIRFDGDGRPDTESGQCYGVELGGDRDADGVCDRLDLYPDCIDNIPSVCRAGDVTTGREGEGARLGIPIDRVLGLVDGAAATMSGAKVVAERRSIQGRVASVLDPQRLVSQARDVIESSLGRRD